MREQLQMRRFSLDDLPEMPPLPPGYTLRTQRSDADPEPLAALLRTAFETASWTAERVYSELLVAEGVPQTFVIDFEDRPVATASALLLPERFPGSGIVHWVAADPGHKGKRLGYCVSLAVLRLFGTLGCQDALLKTDDERLAAIRTYFNLGFVPDNCHPSHPERWKSVLAALAAGRSLP
jgi:mycothiol synthase